MKKRYLQFSKNWRRAGLVSAFAITTALNAQAQTAPAKSWDKTIGGSGAESLFTLRQTADGGYIFGGSSDSGISGDKSQASKGGVDYWMVKTDASGNKTWDKSFGGNLEESLTCVQQTADGGFIIGGHSKSGINGDKSQASKGDFDYWIIKLDASGNKTWDKSFGGSAADNLFSMQQTADGGYILAGYSASGISGDKTQASKGGLDYWVIKLDASGTKTWDKTFGGSTDDKLFSMQQTADGGYILGGMSNSGLTGDKSQASKGGNDYWVIKLDGSGNKTWDKTLGGSADDITVLAIQQTTDGGYILGGYSQSGISGDKTQANKGNWDSWIVKLDGSGNKTWDKTYGGSDADNLRSLQQTSDGGYVFGAFSLSGISGDKTQANKGGNDYWIVKLDGSGNKTWDKTLGGSGADSFNSLRQTSDGGYILGGTSDTGLNGDKSQASNGGNDFWVVKLAAPAAAAPGDMGVTAITSANSGCNLTNQETITITVNNLGTAAQSNIPVSYKINATGTPVNEVVPGPVAPGASVTYSFTAKANLSALGNYTIEARTNLTGDASAGNDMVSKVVTNYATPAAPAITNSGASAICSGSSVTLTAASTTTGATYQWYNNGAAIPNATSATYVATAAGSYTATAIVGGSCASPASAPTVLTVNATPPQPAINVTSSLTICTGDSVALTATSTVTGATFTWFKGGNIITGATGATYMAKTAGSYTAMATSNGCTSVASVARTVTTKNTPPTPTITRNGNILTSSSLSGNQWFKNGTAIPGATTSTLNASSNGTYTVKVTANGCTSAASNAVTIANTGINDDKNTLAVSVYPNPSNGIFNLNMPEGQAYELVVTDLTGKVIQQKTVKANAAQLDLNNAAKGVYMLKITGENKTATRKLIVE